MVRPYLFWNEKTNTRKQHKIIKIKAKYQNCTLKIYYILQINKRLQHDSKYTIKKYDIMNVIIFSLTNDIEFEV